ncbi:membrane protein [Limoniibacter endophyticus]|uniref:Membrane protein n=1 Tax=Limoniibacter endophyticus TaxID=1565040 RepID=A0A8J3DQV9_9HYPH|nr:autotransporter assembly complex family protein [Limoniibacter endophyticus]GHC75030.1 membrane protein [Limoniibacter endophyticus]
MAGLVIGPVAQADAFQLFGFRFFEGDKEEAAVDIVDPLNYTVTLTMEQEDSDVERALRDASSLINDEDIPVSGSLGLIVKARGDRERLVATLYNEARYQGVITVLINGRDIDDLPPDAQFGTGPVPIEIRASPGPEFKLGNIRLAGDAAGLDPADFDLVSGSDASSRVILKAEDEIVRRLKEEGRPLARVVGREVVADHRTATLDVTLNLEAGPLGDFGETTVGGTELVDREFTEYMVGLEPGTRYSPERVDKARERLLDLGVFSSVAMKEGTGLDPNGRLPIDVEVKERKMRYFGVGASYSNLDGAGFEGYWGHRNLFGRAENLRLESSVSRIGATSQPGEFDYKGGIIFEKPGVIGPPSKFFAKINGVWEHPDAYDRLSVKGTVGVSYELTERQTVSAEFALEWSQIDDAFGRNRYLLASVPLQYVYDSRDNKLNPTEGIRALAFAEPTYDILNGTPFAKLQGEVSAYYSFTPRDSFILAGRVKAGSLVGAGLSDVPADRRFYAGGGGSVRGYSYQGIGPKNADGEPIGGLSLAEASLEARIAITETVGIVPFIDAGSVSTENYPDFSDMKFGAGVGLRYLTSFGPLRLDVAMPLNRDPDDARFGIYAGIGQAF